MHSCGGEVVRLLQELPVHRELELVYAAFQSVGRWPAMTTHLRRVEMLYEDSTVQVLRMFVPVGDHEEVFKTVRLCKPCQWIHYEQPEPPRYLEYHAGSWEFREIEAGVSVRSEHSFQFRRDGVHELLVRQGVSEPHTSKEVARAEAWVKRVIGQNSLRTMHGIKHCLETIG